MGNFWIKGYADGYPTPGEEPTQPETTVTLRSEEDNDYIRHAEVMQLMAGYQTSLTCNWVASGSMVTGWVIGASNGWSVGELARLRQGLYIIDMTVFAFKSILLHTLPDFGGWEVYGLPHSGNRRRTVIAVLDPVASEDIARLVASAAAQQLAGRCDYDED